MGGKTFELQVRVPYAHVDQMGFVYYANYFVYFEMARSDFLRETGLPYAELEAKGVLLPVVEASCEYKRPARFDDLLTVRSQCLDIKGTRLRIRYEVIRGDDLLATGSTAHVCMSPEGKVLRPVEALNALL